VVIGQSTNENIRAVWDGTPNPYNQGCPLNYYDMCLQSVPYSRLPSMNQEMGEDEFLQNLGPAWAARSAAQAAEAGEAMSRGRPQGRNDGTPATRPLSPLARLTAALTSTSPPKQDFAKVGSGSGGTPSRSSGTLTPLLKAASKEKLGGYQ